MPLKRFIDGIAGGYLETAEVSEDRGTSRGDTPGCFLKIWEQRESIDPEKSFRPLLLKFLRIKRLTFSAKSLGTKI